MTGKKWIGHARLLAQVPSTSIEYCKVYKIPRRIGPPVPWSRVLGSWVHCFYLPIINGKVQMQMLLKTLERVVYYSCT